MPETRVKPEAGQSGNDSNNDRDRQMFALLTTTVEQIRSVMSASGAVIAVRDSEGGCCLASTGEAPPVGSRLQPDSAFTRECFETGEVVICEDAENDLRILPSVAKSLCLRSAVAVPIQIQGSVIGVIEVFSSRPSDIYPAHVDLLKECANLVSPIIASTGVPSAQPVGNAASPTSSTEQQEGEPASVSSKWFPKESTTPLDLGSIRPTIEQRPPTTAEFPGKSMRSVDASTARQISRGRIASLSFLAFVLFFLFFFMLGATRLVTTGTTSTIGTSSRSLAPHVSGQIIDALPTNLSSANAEKTVVTVSSRKEERPTMAAAREAPAVLAGQDSKLSGSLSTAIRPLPAPAIAADVPKLEIFDPSAEPLGAAMFRATPAVNPSSNSPVSAAAPDFVLERTLKGHSGWVTGIAFSSDGRRLASGSWDQTIKFWDVPTGQELNTVGKKVKEIQALTFSRDGHWLAAEDSKDIVILWDATTGREIRTFVSDRTLGALGSSWVYSIAFSPDGRWLASAINDKTVRLWDVTTGRAVRDFTALRRSVVYVAFSPDGRWLASGNDDKSIRIWNVSTGKEIRTLAGHKKTIYAVAFSPNGHWLASASGDKSIKLWDIATGRDVYTLRGHGNAVTSLAFSPDGRWLASGSWDKTVKIWDVETGNELQTLPHARNHSIYSVAFDSHGQWVASGSEDGSISLWRVSRFKN